MSFYSSTIFAQAGYTTLQCLLASMGFGLVNVSLLWCHTAASEHHILTCTQFIFAFPAILTVSEYQELV